MLDGRQETTIATRSCDEAEPAWSPDGRNIVYQSDCNGSYDIWVSDVMNRNQYAINPTNDKDQREPDVSPDGTQIVYRVNPKGTNRNANGEIWVMNWNGSGAQYFGFVGRSPTWSPDGSQIAYMSDVSGIWQIYVHDLAQPYIENDHRLQRELSLAFLVS
jgi:TolB protein